MAKKKRTNTEEIPVDKVEAFLERNFKKILMALGGTIGLVIVIYVAFSVIQSSKQQKISQLGQYEHMLQIGAAKDADIEQFVAFGSSIDEVSDYTRLKAASYYIENGDRTKAETLLQQMSGKYKELADSVLFDLGHNIDIFQYLKNSYLEQLWQYRNILTSEYSEESIEKFDKKYSGSRLTDLLRNWEQL